MEETLANQRAQSNSTGKLKLNQESRYKYKCSHQNQETKKEKEQKIREKENFAQETEAITRTKGDEQDSSSVPELRRGVIQVLELLK